MKKKISIFWFRRDLRLFDNVGLHYALSSVDEVLPLFIFDEIILSKLENKKDRRVDYIHQALTEINKKLKSYGTTLNTFYGNPLDVYKKLIEKYNVQAVFCNRDYEPNAIDRDKEIYYFLKAHNIALKGYKDQVIFDRNEILKKDGKPYTVYTPYLKKWKQALKKEYYSSYDLNFDNFYKQTFSEILSLQNLGFEKSDIQFTSPTLDALIISEYDIYRDFPAIQKTTQLGIALRFGTISIRKCVEFALKYNDVWLSELIWREFFMQILYHFPNIINQSFKKKYDEIKWRNNELEFEKWCIGETGYPIVDAGMRQLNKTGYMHNRVRMIVASFLCKHLLIDWRWGETYFAQKLNDYDLSANNGNWQWASGSGCDAAPYFRVFNPEIQTKKFDKDHQYIKKWVPEYETSEYVKPIVEHRSARERALQVYGNALKK